MASQPSTENFSLLNGAGTRQSSVPIWRLPQELLDIIFELAFATDVPLAHVPLAQRTCTKNRSLYLTQNTLNPTPVPSGTRNKNPAELSVSQRWYHAALRSWLGTGTVEINPYTLRRLRNWPSKYQTRITSIKFRAATQMDVVYPDPITWPMCPICMPPKESEQQQHEHYSYRRQVVQDSIREILRLCPNLLRLEMDMLDCIVGALHFGSIPDWQTISTEVQSPWKHLILSHFKIQHLAIACPGQEVAGVLDRAKLVARYLNIMLKCRKHNTDVSDHRALARAIGYDLNTRDSSGIDSDTRERSLVLMVCCGLFNDADTIPLDSVEDRNGRWFFFGALCKERQITYL